MTRPWMKFYPADWRADPRLRMCSLASRGLWIDLMSYMHEGEPYGHLLIDGTQPDLPGIASLVGRPLQEVRKAILELDTRGVFSRTDDGAIYSRRMTRDKAKESVDVQNGKWGGNPIFKGAVKGGVNPPDKAHMLEARILEPERKKERTSLREVPPPVRGSRLPLDWEPNDTHINFAENKGFRLDRIGVIAQKFRNYWTSKSGKDACKINWDRTWENWILNELERGGSAARAPPNAKRGFLDLALELERDIHDEHDCQDKLIEKPTRTGH